MGAIPLFAPTVELAGGDQPGRTWWLLPVAVEEPAELIVGLRAAGIDASAATTKLAALAAPAGRDDAEPVVADGLLARLVCLPAYPELPEPAFRRMLEVVRHAHAKDRPDWRSRA